MVSNKSDIDGDWLANYVSLSLFLSCIDSKAVSTTTLSKYCSPDMYSTPQVPLQSGAVPVCCVDVNMAVTGILRHTLRPNCC